MHNIHTEIQPLQEEPWVTVPWMYCFHWFFAGCPVCTVSIWWKAWSQEYLKRTLSVLLNVIGLSIMLKCSLACIDHDPDASRSSEPEGLCHLLWVALGDPGSCFPHQFVCPSSTCFTFFVIDDVRDGCRQKHVRSFSAFARRRTDAHWCHKLAIYKRVTNHIHRRAGSRPSFGRSVQESVKCRCDKILR